VLRQSPDAAFCNGSARPLLNDAFRIRFQTDRITWSRCLTSHVTRRRRRRRRTVGKCIIGRRHVTSQRSMSGIESIERSACGQRFRKFPDDDVTTIYSYPIIQYAELYIEYRKTHTIAAWLLHIQGTANYCLDKERRQVSSVYSKHL